MHIVDAQVHIWTSGTPVHIHRQASSYTKDELLRDMDTAGVTACLLHPPSWDVIANEVSIDAAKKHMARPRFSIDDAGFSDLPELLALAKYPNVAVKATGGPSYSSEVYPYRNIHPYIKQIFDAFGPDRMFWGTDITRMPCTWKQCVTLYTEEMPWLKGRDLELVMGRALCNFIGWKL